MSTAFAPVATQLAGEVSSRVPDEMGGRARRTTIATNSSLVERRAELLVGLLRRETDVGDLRGRRVLDVGAGFGGIALYLASVHGAEVVAVDKHRDRLDVARTVAETHGLPVTTVRSRMEDLAKTVAPPFDVAILNNSFAYVVEPDARAATLRAIRDLLADGGWAIARDPNRWQLIDPFSRLPLVHLLAPRAAVRAAGRLGRHRSLTRITSPVAARRELEQAGFSDVRAVGRPALAGRYHHVVARRPA